MFTLVERDLVDYLFDRADEPCGKTTPEKVVRAVKIAWQKWGLPSICTDWSFGAGRQLKAQLSAKNLRAVRKALNYPLVIVVAMELEAADPWHSTMKPLELGVITAELLKF